MNLKQTTKYMIHDIGGFEASNMVCRGRPGHTYIECINAELWRDQIIKMVMDGVKFEFRKGSIHVFYED